MAHGYGMDWEGMVSQKADDIWNRIDELMEVAEQLGIESIITIEEHEVWSLAQDEVDAEYVTYCESKYEEMRDDELLNG